MMIRALTVSLLLAVMAAPAYAQDSDPETPPATNPQTRQTDQSEDDYRRSQRRRDTGDIFEDIGINQGSTGSGGILGREVKAIDRLDQESRRHLNKQRAKALAEAEPGEPIDAAYEPSEAAKTDEYTARQEANAWKEMMEEANSGLSGTTGQSGGQGGGQGQPAGDPSQSPDQAASDQAASGQSGSGPSGTGQAGQEGDSQTRPNNSPLRGGSASSASSILDRIKGRGGSAPQSGTPPSSSETPQGQSQAGQPQAAETQTDRKANMEAEAQAAAEADAREHAQKAAPDAAAPNAAAEAAAHHETMSPLERLKNDPIERDDTGGRTSASDYLNRKKD